jgi:hypothetical protein
MNLNFKLTSQKSKLAHYEENMKNSLYILQWGEQVCAKTMCDANDRLCTHEKFVLAAKPGEYGYMSGDSGQDVRSIRLRTRSIRTFCTEHKKQQVITI